MRQKNSVFEVRKTRNNLRANGQMQAWEMANGTCAEKAKDGRSVFEFAAAVVVNGSFAV